MDLGFIENKTYEEISVGDTAATEHVLTMEDAMAWASISGFAALSDSEGLTDRAVSSMPPTGPNMWCASLISGLFATKLPGPGCSLKIVSLSVPKSHSRRRTHSRQNRGYGQGRFYKGNYIRLRCDQ